MEERVNQLLHPFIGNKFEGFFHGCGLRATWKILERSCVLWSFFLLDVNL